MQEEKGRFCAYCGAPISDSTETEAPATCRASCTRKLNGLCKKLAEKVRSLQIEGTQEHGGEFVPHKRDLRDSLWKRLNQPVLSPDRSVREIGDKRIRLLLACMLLDPSGGMAIHHNLDRATYEKLVGNGWCEWDEKLYNGLCHQARERECTKGRLPWER